MSVPALETARLLLRPLALGDAPAIQAHFPRWEIVRHLASRVPWPYPPDGALVFVRDQALPAMERGDAWHWSLRLREAPGELVGVGGLLRGERENRGLWIGLPWQGRGLGTEACQALAAYWFDALGMPVLRVPKASANAASRRLSASAGMRVVDVREGDFVAGRMTEELWELTADEWRARAG
ncbi:MAG: GNAT family N-acetyltransferase [Anaeromyxobacter sp.]|nr:GNAT family N-acetyltransferase [Anaeromyxobacter sp.]MBL0276446.1 GNAT family N-acetyltransferase [Anaeromyxobacter sp.]